jgi:hypothetical protein
MVVRRRRHVFTHETSYSRTKQINIITPIHYNVLEYLNDLTSDIVNNNETLYNYDTTKYNNIVNSLKSKEYSQKNIEIQTYFKCIEILRLFKTLHINMNINYKIINYIDGKYDIIKTELNELKQLCMKSDINIIMNQIDSMLYLQVDTDERFAWHTFLNIISEESISLESAENIMNYFKNSKEHIIKFIDYLND